MKRKHHERRQNNVWVDLHKWGGLALGVGVLIHVLLHWKWLVRKTGRYLRPRKEAEPNRCQAEMTGIQPELN
jgi:hypothetical protein